VWWWVTAVSTSITTAVTTTVSAITTVAMVAASVSAVTATRRHSDGRVDGSRDGRSGRAEGLSWRRDDGYVGCRDVGCSQVGRVVQRLAAWTKDGGAAGHELGKRLGDGWLASSWRWGRWWSWVSPVAAADAGCHCNSAGRVGRAELGG